jgi:hypothetical protein
LERKLKNDNYKLLSFGGASRDRTDDLIVAKDGVCQSLPFVCLRLAAIHVPKRSNSGLPGELPQQFFRLAAHGGGRVIARSLLDAKGQRILARFEPRGLPLNAR